MLKHRTKDRKMDIKSNGNCRSCQWADVLFICRNTCSRQLILTQDHQSLLPFLSPLSHQFFQLNLLIPFMFLSYMV